jgi:hypothetical protein
MMKRIERLTVRKRGAELAGGRTNSVRTMIARRAAREFQVRC